MEKIELKPCPFCGKIPKVIANRYAVCETENCPMEAMAIKVSVWNLRTTGKE